MNNRDRARDYVRRIINKASRMMRGEREMGVIVIVSQNSGNLELCQAGHSEQSLLGVVQAAYEMLDKDRLALKLAVRGDPSGLYESPVLKTPEN